MLVSLRVGHEIQVITHHGRPRSELLVCQLLHLKRRTWQQAQGLDDVRTEAPCGIRHATCLKGLFMGICCRDLCPTLNLNYSICLLTPSLSLQRRAAFDTLAPATLGKLQGGLHSKLFSGTAVVQGPLLRFHLCLEGSVHSKIRKLGSPPRPHHARAA